MKAPAKKQLRQIRYDVKKAQILESAARVFSVKGFEKAAMEEIADELYMTKGSLYYYIKSKEDMLFQCHMKALKMANEVLNEALKSDLQPELKLHKAIVGHVEVVTEEFVVGTLRQQELLLPRRMRLKVIAERDKFQGNFLKILEEGIRSGDFSQNNLKMKAFFILGAINWIPRWYSSSGENSPKEIGETIANLATKLMKA